MRTKLQRCPIDYNWYYAKAHNGHCPTCGAFTLNKRNYDYTFSETRLVELVSGLVRVRINSEAQMLMAAQAIAEN